METKLEPINFITRTIKRYLGDIDYTALDKNNNSYFFQEFLFLLNMINKVNINKVNDINFINNLKSNFLILSFNDIKMQQFIQTNFKYDNYLKEFKYNIDDNKLLYLTIDIKQFDKLDDFLFEHLFICSNKDIEYIDIKSPYYINNYIDYMPNLKKIQFTNNINLKMNKCNVNVKKIKYIEYDLRITKITFNKKIDDNIFINKANKIDCLCDKKSFDLKNLIILTIDDNKHITIKTILSNASINFYCHYIFYCINIYNSYSKILNDDEEAFYNNLKYILFSENLKRFKKHNEYYDNTEFNDMFKDNKLCLEFMKNIEDNYFLSVINKYFNNINLSFDDFKNDIIKGLKNSYAYIKVDDDNIIYNNFIKYLRLFYEIKNNIIERITNIINNRRIIYIIKDNRLYVSLKRNNKYKVNINNMILIKLNKSIKLFYLKYKKPLKDNIYINRIPERINNYFGYKNDNISNNIDIIL